MSTSIGNTARQLIATMQGASNQEILDKVLQVHQGAKTTLACIAWYKSDMKKNHKVERTEEIVQAEIQATAKKLVELNKELEEMQAASRDDKLAQYEKLKAELGM